MNRLARIGLFVGLLAAACTAPQAQPSGSSQGEASPPRGTRSITIGFSSTVQSMGIMGATTTSGGWQSLNEIHSNGLVTSDVHSRNPVPRLAARLPSLEDGSISLLPDGRMRVVYALRP